MFWGEKKAEVQMSETEDVEKAKPVAGKPRRCRSTGLLHLEEVKCPHVTQGIKTWTASVVCGEDIPDQFMLIHLEQINS